MLKLSNLVIIIPLIDARTLTAWLVRNSFEVFDQFTEINA